MKKLLSALIVVLSLSFTASAQEPGLPFAGEGYWKTNSLTTPVYEEVVDTIVKSDGTPKIRRWYQDTSFSVTMPCQWVIGEHLWQILPEGYRMWAITSSAVTACGQVAEYQVELAKESAYAAPTRPKPTSATTAKKIVNDRKATVIVLCPQGQFSSILLIEDRGVATYHN